MSNPVSRGELLADIKTRLLAGNALPLDVGNRVFVARLSCLAESEYPAVLLYAPDEVMDPLGAAWEWGREIKITIEVQVKHGDGKDAEAWVSEADAILTGCLNKLLSDLAWRRLWKSAPRIHKQQFLRRENNSVPHVGEAATLTLIPQRPVTAKVLAEALTGLDVAYAPARPDGSVPHILDTMITLNVET